MNIATTFVIKLIKIYKRIISPLLGNNCRFYPSCSSYAVTAIEKHGLLIGLIIAFYRILRCNPWNGGIDEVPENITFNLRFKSLKKEKQE